MRKLDFGCVFEGVGQRRGNGVSGIGIECPEVDVPATRNWGLKPGRKGR